MRILIASPSSTLYKRPYSGFRAAYDDGQTPPFFWGNFGWYWSKALIRLGHVVRTTPTSVVRTRLQHSCLDRWYGVLKRRTGLRKLEERTAARRLLRSAREFRPDLVLVDSGYDLPAQAVEGVRQEAKTPVVLWLLDDAIRQNWGNTIASFPHYDCVFACDRCLIAPYLSRGAKRVEYLPCACDTDVFHPVGTERVETLGLCFVGTVTAARAETLARLADFDLHIWTWSPWNLPPQLRSSRYYHGRAFGGDANAVFNSARIALNLHHPQAILGTNMRTFEAAAAAAFQLTEYKQDLQELFDLDRELVCFRSEEELRDLIPRYLRAESERREKAEAARERVWARHTFTHRLSTLLRQLS